MQNGTTMGTNRTTGLVCELWKGSSSSGLWKGEDPTKFSTPLLLLQVSLVSSFSALLQAILRPLGHSFVTQMLAGIFLGPSGMGRSKKLISKLFCTRGVFMIDFLETICFMFIAYFNSAQVDFAIIKKGGRLAIINGTSLFVLPILVSYSTVAIILHTIDSSIAKMSPRQLYHLGRMQCTVYFLVIYEVLLNLKMLNSELGRLALSSVMVTNCLGQLFLVVVVTYFRSLNLNVMKSVFWPVFSKLLLVVGIVVVCRPIFMWIVRKTPEGQQLKHAHQCIIAVMLCTCAFLAETVGFPYIIGAAVLGLVTPRKSPFGPGLLNKMGCFVWAFLVPCYVIGIGQQVDIYAFTLKDFVILEILLLVITATKFASVVVPSLYFKVPVSHSMMLGLTVSIQGIYDVQLFKQALNFKYVSKEGYGVTVVSAMFHSTIATTILKNLYDSRHKLVAYRMRTVQHCTLETPLRILTCFTHRETVPSILSLLGLCGPSKSSPLSISTLYLEELEINTLPQIIHHQVDPSRSFMSLNHRDQIVNAFLNHLHKNQGNLSVDCYTALAPRKTMHEDVWAVAFDKETNLVILAVDLEAETSAVRLRSNVRDNSLCSVAILVGRSRLPNLRFAATRHLRIKVCAIFLGGADDRETLAFAMRMANHQSVELHVLRLMDHENITPFGSIIQRRFDNRAIYRFREEMVDNENVVFREVRVEDGGSLVETLRKEGDEYDLMMVGIRHDKGLHVLKGLSAWSEKLELGEIGDLLVSTDLNLRASVLVVQQQLMVVRGMDDNLVAYSPWQQLS